MPELTRRDFLAAGASALALPAFRQEPAGLIAHEWGLVSVAYGSTVWGAIRSAGSRAMKGAEVPSDLPPFVSVWEKEVKAQVDDWRMQPVNKPVLYFYASGPMDVRVEVSIPTGHPTAWWPYASAFAPGFEGKPMRGMEDPDELPVKIATTQGRILWEKLSLDPALVKFPKAAGWWTTARVTDATPFRFAPAASDYKFGTSRFPTLGAKEPHAEKFLFYDAMAPFDAKLDVAWTTEGDAVVRNLGPAVPTIIALRVKGGVCSSATATDVANDAKITLTPAKGPPALARELVRAGLYAKEADSIAEIWKEEFFKVDGARVLALMPRAVFDTLLPIDIKPAPKELVRVLIAHLECLDPEIRIKADTWIAAFASESIEEREVAAAELKKLGPLAESLIRSSAEKAKDEEVKSRLLELLKK